MAEDQPKINHYLRNKFLIASLIIFVLALFLTIVGTYNAFEISKDGDFCNYKKVHLGELDYDFMISEEIGCDFLLSGLIEPLLFFILINFPQPLLWVIYYLIRKKRKNHG